MQRIVLAVLVLAIAVALIAVAARVAARAFQSAGPGQEMARSEGMGKIAYFVLLALMVYVATSGDG